MTPLTMSVLRKRDHIKAERSPGNNSRPLVLRLVAQFQIVIPTRCFAPPRFSMSLTPDQLAYQMAHIDQDRGPYLIATTAVLSVLSTAAIYLRFLVRWRTKVGFKTDDYAILLAGVSRTSHRTMRNPMLIQT